MSDLLFDALRAAVAASPDDAALRLHLARRLVDAGRGGEAVGDLAVMLARDPADTEVRALMVQAMSAPGTAVPVAPAASAAPAPAPAPTPAPEPTVAHPVWPVADPAAAAAPAFPAPAFPAAAPAIPAPAIPAPEAAAPTPPAPEATPGTAAPTTPVAPAPSGFDWDAAENQLDSDVAPMFVGDRPSDVYEVQSSAIRLSDVAGMVEVKRHLEASFLAPLKNEELRRAYGKSLRGGLLMYGPPGCGKTFVARAVAGELGAKFITVGLSDVLDGMFGQSEANVHELFQLARREAPCVVFLDELDALGQRRSASMSSLMRGVVVQLLQELDSMSGENEGVFVLAASNEPWAIDPALRRPGRFDRTLLVLPPDTDARAAIFRLNLNARPIEGIDLGRLAALSEGLSGADIAYVCERATETALMDSVATGTVRTIRMADLERVLAEARPSTAPWLESARNMVAFGEDDGTFAQLRGYLKKAKRL